MPNANAYIIDCDSFEHLVMQLYRETMFSVSTRVAGRRGLTRDRVHRLIDDVVDEGLRPLVRQLNVIRPAEAQDDKGITPITPPSSYDYQYRRVKEEARRAMHERCAPDIFDTSVANVLSGRAEAIIDVRPTTIELVDLRPPKSSVELPAAMYSAP